LLAFDFGDCWLERGTRRRKEGNLGQVSSSTRTTPRQVKGAIVKAIHILWPLLVALTLPACTAERVYGSAQAWQQNQCSKIPDKAEFDRCMSKASTPYDSYKRQTEPAQK